MNTSTSLPSCNHVLSTPPPSLASSASNQFNSSFISSYGILFTLADDPMQSFANSTSQDITVTSLGFYLDNSKLFGYLSALSAQANETISYQVYTLNGYYADPVRRGAELGTNAYNGGGLPIDYDYRGNFSYWTMIANGTFGIDDLIDAGHLGNVSYYTIPVDEFEPVHIPSDYEINRNNGSGDPDGSVISFYLTLQEVGALYRESLENWESLNDPQQLLYCGKQFTTLIDLEYGQIPSNCDVNQQQNLPILQIGEGVASHPFYSTPYFYTPRKFVGSIFVESNDCPTESPTVSSTDIPSSSSINSSQLSLAPSASSMDSSDAYIDAILNGCHRYISTDENYSNFSNETVTSYGIVFPVQTNAGDDDGILITSLGFHIDFSQFTPNLENEESAIEIDYQVYTLIDGGYYADPNRVTSDKTPQDYDYRGNFTYWKVVASGTISESFLSFYSSNENDKADFYQIPWDRFQPTYIPPNGGVQSFYLTLNSGSLVLRELVQKQSIGKIQKDDNYQRNYEGLAHPPILLIGEGVIGYPFNTMPFLYTAKQFVGKLYYEIECPSESPSSYPTTLPSVSLKPSSIPSFEPSMMPTPDPSESPSIQPSISMMPHSVVETPKSTSAMMQVCSTLLMIGFGSLVLSMR
jgi:hypothetical protein